MIALNLLSGAQAEHLARSPRKVRKATGKKILGTVQGTALPALSFGTGNRPAARAASGFGPGVIEGANELFQSQREKAVLSRSLKLKSKYKKTVYRSLQSIIEVTRWKNLNHKKHLQTRLLVVQLALRGMEKGRASEAKQDGRSPSQCSEAQPKIIPITINLSHEVQAKIKAGGIAAFCLRLTEQVEKALGYSLPLWLGVEDARRVHFHGEVLANEAELEAFRAVVHKLSKVSLETFRNRVLVSSEHRRRELEPLLGPRLTTLFWGSYSLKDTPDIPGTQIYVSRQINQQARALYPSLRSRLIKHLLDQEERRQDEERAMVAFEDRLAEEHQHALKDEYDARYSAEVDHDPSRIAAKISRITALIAAPKNKVSLSRELPTRRPRPKPLLERINQAREQRRIQDEETRREWNQFKPLLAGLW
jgi:hypothetical protein